MADGGGTSGGWQAMNGAQRRITLSSAAGFALIIVLVLIANAESSISDLAAGGAHIPAHLVWSWEWSSIIAWLSVCPAIWWAVARIRPPRLSWPVVVIAIVLGSLMVAAWHIGLMVAIRHVYYRAVGAGTYAFFGTIADRLVYEYRKDVTTYLQFVALAAGVQWAIARAADPTQPELPAQTLAVSDGAVTHHVPVPEVERVTAAGNYVELHWAGRTLLHRATLSTIEAELGAAFVRVHRGQLVRRDAIRRVVVDKSGDFHIGLASGAEVRGSRRYRAGIEGSASV